MPQQKQIIRKSERTKDEEVIESERIEPSISRDIETEKLLEKSKRFLSKLEGKEAFLQDTAKRKEFLEKLKKEGARLDKLSLLVEMPFVSLTDSQTPFLVARLRGNPMKSRSVPLFQTGLRKR